MSFHRFPARALAQAKLLELQKSGAVITFCTNKMIYCGTVYHCKISENLEAVVEYTQSWHEMQYSDRSTVEAGKILGLIEIKMISGTLMFGFYVKHLSEGNG